MACGTASEVCTIVNPSGSPTRRIIAVRMRSPACPFARLNAAARPAVEAPARNLTMTSPRTKSGPAATDNDGPSGTSIAARVEVGGSVQAARTPRLATAKPSFVFICGSPNGWEVALPPKRRAKNICFRARFVNSEPFLERVLNAGVPLVALITPVPAIRRWHEHDPGQVFRVLVAKLYGRVKPRRCAVCGLQHLSVETVGHDRLRMHRALEIPALVIVVVE